MFVMKYKKIFLSIGLLFILASVISIFVWGLEPSIEFSGGSIVEVSFGDSRPDRAELEELVSVHTSLSGVTIQTVGENGYSIRTPFLEEAEHSALLGSLEERYAELEIERVSSVGATVGDELKRRSMWAIVAVIIAIILFIAFSFRKVAAPLESGSSNTRVSSWKYGIVAIIALIHDTIIPAGVFAILGYYFGYQVDVLFITAILAILGYSVNDTIIVFDRIRENLQHNQEIGLREEFETVVGRSLSQTYARSLNTSATTLLVLVMLLFVGSEATRHFALVMVIGIVAGVYSSIFLAAPLLVFWDKYSKKS